MSKTFRPYKPDQIILMPASMQDWLPADHMAYFISDVVDHLDLSAIMERYAGEERGYPPYHPAMMVKVLIYGYATGVFSSRKIAKKLHEDVALRSSLSATSTTVGVFGVRSSAGVEHRNVLPPRCGISVSGLDTVWVETTFLFTDTVMTQSTVVAFEISPPDTDR